MNGKKKKLSNSLLWVFSKMKKRKKEKIENFKFCKMNLKIVIEWRIKKWMGMNCWNKYFEGHFRHFFNFFFFWIQKLRKVEQNKNCKEKRILVIFFKKNKSLESLCFVFEFLWKNEEKKRTLKISFQKKKKKKKKKKTIFFFWEQFQRQNVLEAKKK